MYFGITLFEFEIIRLNCKPTQIISIVLHPMWLTVLNRCLKWNSNCCPMFGDSDSLSNYILNVLNANDNYSYLKLYIFSVTWRLDTMSILWPGERQNEIKLSILFCMKIWNYVLLCVQRCSFTSFLTFVLWSHRVTAA